MEVGSPENGFDEISDLLKDDESTLPVPEDIDISFLLNKDVASDYVYDDLESENKFDFHFSEQGQSELPALFSNFRYFDNTPLENFHSSARTGCSSDVLLDTDPDVHSDEEKLQFRSLENHHNEDTEKLCAGYLHDSASQVDLVSINDDGPMDIFRHPQLLLQDTNLEEEMVRMPDSLQNNGICEETLSEILPEELNQSDFTFMEEDDDIPVHQIEKRLLSPSLYGVGVESDSENVRYLRNCGDGNKELDSLPVDENGTSFCAIQPPDYQSLSITHHVIQDASSPNVSNEQECCQADCMDPTLDHSLHISMENSVPSPGSCRSSQQTQGPPANHVATPEINSQRVQRSLSQSPVRQRDSSSRSERVCNSNSEARSPYSRGWHKRSSETAVCSHQSPGSSSRHVSGSHSRSQRHKHDLFRKTDRGREVTSMDHLPHAGLQNSASPRESWRQFKSSSSSKCSPASPRNQSSHRSGHRKVERSGSISPVRRRDFHAEKKRERDRSRSRSPHARDRSRRRCFRRHRSPARIRSSHHRSPESRHSLPVSYRRTGRGKPGTCLFVAGFAFSTTERELTRKFSRFGRVRDVRVIRDRRSGISRGYGFLSLERDEEADAAIRAVHKTDWNGRIVLVEKSINCTPFTST